MQRFGVNITRAQMANWLILLKLKIQPLLNLLKDEIIAYDIASMDATQLQVLKEPGRPPTRKSYAYCFRGGPSHKKVVIMEYNAENHKPYVADCYCNAHARRKFEPIAKAVQTEISQSRKSRCLSLSARTFYSAHR